MAPMSLMLCLYLLRTDSIAIVGYCWPRAIS